MKLEIFEESRLDDQVDFIDEVTDTWNWKPWYPSKEQLKVIYSREGFTADTRHYVYDGDELVGFLSSAVERIVNGIQTGSIHIPFVKEGNIEVEEELMKKTIEILKAKDVKAIYAYIMPAWGNVEEIITKRGFEKTKLLAYRTLISVKKYVETDYEKPENLQDLDLIRDKDLVVDIIHKVYLEQIRGITMKEVEKIIDDTIAENNFIAGSTQKIGENITCGLLYKAYQSEKGFLRIFSLLKDKEVNLITETYRFLVQKADRAGIELLWHQVPDTSLVDRYKQFQLDFEPLNEYVLRLE